MSEKKDSSTNDIDFSADSNDQKDEYKGWLTFAMMDQESAKYLNEAPILPKPLNVICFHCQQAAEKAVKALIVYLGNQGGMPKSHDISFLLNQIKNLLLSKKGIEIKPELIMTANYLSKFGIAPRYPNEIEVDEYHARKALSDSEALLKWVTEAMGMPDLN